MKLEFSKDSQIPNFIKIPSVDAEFFHADGQADMTKQIFAFRKIANSPESWYLTGSEQTVVMCTDTSEIYCNEWHICVNRVAPSKDEC